MRTFFSIIYQTFFVLGLFSSFFLLFGLAADFRSLEKPKESMEMKRINTVSPIDFELFFELSPQGVVKHGFVSDYHIDCTSGIITFTIRGEFDLRYGHFSNRAFKVYNPADACRAGGFTPDF